MLASLSEYLPHSMRGLMTPAIVTVIAVFSLVMFVATAVAVPWFFTRIPPDHYVDRERYSMPFVPPGSPWRPPFVVLKNLLGVVLIALGLLMLVLPGQGVLTIAVGLMLLNFPGKRRFLRWLISRGPIYRGINALRRRAHQPPLELEATANDAGR
jgi:hypothetical protein